MTKQKANEVVILVVDDYPYNLTAVNAILSDAGYKDILMTSSGREALSILREKKVDLILLDIMMPDLDGFEVCSKLQSDEETSDIPIIMLTAKISSKDLKKGFELGAVDYIGKPFDKLELIARVQSALKLKQSRDKLNKKNKELMALTQENPVVCDASNEKSLIKTDEFLNHFLHDIKTSLEPFISLLSALETKEEEFKLEKLQMSSKKNVGHIKNLVESTQKLVKINSKDTVFDFQEINLQNVVWYILGDNQNMYKDKNIRVENRISTGIVVFVDELWVKEVFRNLINNAINSLDNGGILTLGAEENGDGFTTVSIKNSGVSINEKQAVHILNNNLNEGWNELDLPSLDLVICKNIIEKHGGKIWAESPGDDKGASFYFTIPTKRETIPSAAFEV